MKFKYRNKKKIYIIGIISIFLLSTTILYISLFNNKIDSNVNYKYYNEERLINTHQNDNASGKKEKKLEHENYITKKDRKPRAPPPRSNKMNIEQDDVNGSGVGNNKSNSVIIESPKIVMKSKICLNGGIGYQNECICPFSYSGEQCDVKDENEGCNKDNIDTYMFRLYPTNDPEKDKFDDEYSIPSICCWNKYRINQDYGKKYTDEVLIKPTMDNINEQSTYIKSLLNTFGPWEENDKLLFNYLLKSTKINGKEEYYLKYSNEKYSHKGFNVINAQSSNLAFFFLLRNINMEELKLLFTYLYRSKHYYVIHVDNSFNETKDFEELELYLDGLFKESYQIDHFLPIDYPKNYKVMKDRFNGAWGSIGLVYPEIAAYTILLDMVEERSKITKQDEAWTHVINLSINDFPVKAVAELEFFLRLPTNINRNFIENGGNKEKERYTETFLRTKDHNTVAVKFNQSNLCGNENNNNPLIYSTFYKGKSDEGSQWHFITYKFAHYIVSDFNPLRRLLSLKFTMIPDEFYFQQVRNESPIYPNDQIWDTYNYRFIPWDSGRLSVNKEHIEKGFPYVTFFTRKVYSKDIKDLIIKKYIQ